jgi:hypothetical protein
LNILTRQPTGLPDNRGMYRFIFILLSVIIVIYFLRSLIRSITEFLNRKSSSSEGNINSEKAVKKPAITYDKSKVVDADFEEIK